MGRQSEGAFLPPSRCWWCSGGQRGAHGAPCGGSEGHARAGLPEQGRELRTGPCKSHRGVSKGCQWGAKVKARKTVLLGRDQGFCGMWRAEAGLKDWAGAGRAPRAGQALQAGGPEAQVDQGLERPRGAPQEAGLRRRQEGERCSRSPGPAPGGKEGGTESTSRLSTWRGHWPWGGTGQGGVPSWPDRARPVSPHGGAHRLACRGLVPPPEPSQRVFTGSQNP